MSQSFRFKCRSTQLDAPSFISSSLASQPYFSACACALGRGGGREGKIRLGTPARFPVPRGMPFVGNYTVRPWQRSYRVPRTGSRQRGKAHRQKNLLSGSVDTVMEKYVKFSMTEGEEEDDGGRDGVCEYAQEVLSLGLLYMEFNDAIREGDGKRILRCWRYFLLQGERTTP